MVNEILLGEVGIFLDQELITCHFSSLYCSCWGDLQKKAQDSVGSKWI